MSFILPGVSVGEVCIVSADWVLADVTARSVLGRGRFSATDGVGLIILKQ